MCKRLFRGCNNIANGTCVNKKKVWISMEGYAEPWVMVDDHFEPCDVYNGNKCTKTRNEGYYPPEEPNCKACRAKKPNEQLMKKHGTLRLQALVEQRQAEQAVETPVADPSGSPIILDLLTMGPMPTGGPSTASYPTSADAGGTTLGATTANSSSRGGESRGKPGHPSMSAGNLGGKTIIPGPNGGTIGVESLHLNGSESALERPTIRIKHGAAQAGSAIGKRGRSVENTGSSATSSRTSSQASSSRVPIGSGPTGADDPTPKGPKKTDSAAPTPKKKGSTARTPKKKRKKQKS